MEEKDTMLNMFNNKNVKKWQGTEYNTERHQKNNMEEAEAFRKEWIKTKSDIY